MEGSALMSQTVETQDEKAGSEFGADSADVAPYAEAYAAMQAMKKTEHRDSHRKDRHVRIGEHMQTFFERAGLHQGRMLEIGGRDNPYRAMFPRFEYLHMDLTETGPNVVVGDITNCPDLRGEQFDAIISVDVFEHLNRPWLAAEEIGRLLKPGGVTYHSTLFSWRYHPCPIDYWRFTPAALEFLFKDLTRLDAGFDQSERRRNILGKDKNRLKPDAFGGWRENWRVFYAGQKPTHRSRLRRPHLLTRVAAAIRREIALNRE